MELKLSSSCWFKICHQNLDLSGHGVVVADWWIPVIDSFTPPSEKSDVYYWEGGLVAHENQLWYSLSQNKGLALFQDASHLYDS